jgi:hypothetical protein
MIPRRYVRNLTRADEREAVELRETFTDKPAVEKKLLSWGWPKTVREIGTAMAVMYRSDKWRKKGDFEDYKHICESPEPWTLYATPAFDLNMPVHGASEPIPKGWMPENIAVLAFFLGIQCRLYEKRGKELFLPTGDDGLHQVTIPKARLAAARTKEGDLFLTVYTEARGPLLLVFGQELDVEKDGIVG